MNPGTHMPWHRCGVQRTFGSCFSFPRMGSRNQTQVVGFAQPLPIEPSRGSFATVRCRCCLLVCFKLYLWGAGEIIFVFFYMGFSFLFKFQGYSLFVVLGLMPRALYLLGLISTSMLCTPRCWTRKIIYYFF